MRFHPADFVFVQLILPTRHRCGADFRKPNAGRGIARPRTAYFRWVQNNFGIEIDLEIIAHLLHRHLRVEREVFVADDQAGNFFITNFLCELGRSPPVRDHVVNRESSRLARVLERDLRRE